MNSCTIELAPLTASEIKALLSLEFDLEEQNFPTKLAVELKSQVRREIKRKKD